MNNARLLGLFAAALLVVGLTPEVNSATDLFRVLEIATSALITVILVFCMVGYWQRSKNAPDTVLLTGPQYIAIVGCIIALLTAATLVVVGRLNGDHEPASATLIISIAVQPPLLWVSWIMDRKINEVK